MKKTRKRRPRATAKFNPKTWLIAFAIGTIAVVSWWNLMPRTSLPTASVGGPFSLIDHTGKSVSEKDYAGQYILVFFGYTFCPDVCPTDLATMVDALNLLGADAERVQPLFISFDTERDTAASLSEYVKMFDPRVVGLTGTPENIAKAAKAYRVYYAKAVNPSGDASASDEYLMDHSAFTYLMGPSGQFLTTFGHGTAPEEIAKTIRTHLNNG